MKSYFVERTNITPQIQLDSKTGVLTFEGRSIPEDPVEFYNPVLKWINEFYQQNSNKVIVEFKLEYVNSGSSKFILTIFKEIQEKFDQGKEVEVKWYYEEDDEVLFELGSHFKNTFSMPFELIETY